MKPKNLKKLILRIVFGILILANLLLIFYFSSQNAADSAKTSTGVARTVAEVFISNFEEKPQKEQQNIIKELQYPIRKLAHMSEFASLCAWVFLFLSTWSLSLPISGGSALLFSFLCACADEYHQSFSAGRAPLFSDVLIDTLGAVLAAIVLTLIFLLLIKRKGRNKMQISNVELTVCNLPSNLKAVLLTDLHNHFDSKILEKTCAVAPDVILIVGDLLDDVTMRNHPAPALEFLKKCVLIAPTFYSLGNHEVACYHKGNPFCHPTPKEIPEDFRRAVRETGVTLLENDCVQWNRIWICGINSGINGKSNRPDETVLKGFSTLDGPKILLCHHPEYYRPYLKGRGFDLILCGHAHGGHWRVFGHGIYAPGQGLFPKDTSGIVDGVCVISRGLGDHTKIPRIMNPREIVVLSLSKK